MSSIYTLILIVYHYIKLYGWTEDEFWKLLEFILGQGDFSMNEMLHFIKHLFGLCGESHPSILIGGGVFITTIGFYWGRIINYIKELWLT